MLFDTLDVALSDLEDHDAARDVDAFLAGIAAADPVNDFWASPVHELFTIE